MLTLRIGDMVYGRNIRSRMSICAVCKKDITKQKRAITAWECCYYCEDCNTRYGQCKLITTCLEYYDNGEFNWTKNDCWNFKKECDVKSIMICQNQEIEVPVDKATHFPNEKGVEKPYTKLELRETNKNSKGTIYGDECDVCKDKNIKYARRNGVEIHGGE